MCTPTFLNLPEEKRNRILDAAWAEFTAVPFAGASVNQIIRRAGIPRGSFYQYFEDKSDLFNYLMDTVREQILQYRGILSDTGGDLFAAALRGFDLFWERRKEDSDPTADRLIRVMEINPRIDMESFFRGNPETFFAANFLQDVNLSSLRRGDDWFVRRVFCLVSVSLAGAILDTLVHPERVAENRAELVETLDIIKWGSLKDSRKEDAKGGLAS